MNRCTKPMKRMIIKFDERALCLCENGRRGRKFENRKERCNDISDIELILREK